MDHGKSVHQSPGVNVEGETSRDVTGQNGSNKPTRIADCNQTRHQHKDGSDNGSNTENAESSVMNAVRLANYLYPPEEVVDENRERQRSVHNAVERRRKNKINTGIMRIGSLIPTLDTNKVQGKNQILEHAADYIVELQQKYDNLLLEGATDGQAKEINSLKAENERLRKENQHFSKVLRNVKVSAEGVPQLFTDPLDESRATANESMDEGTQEVTSSNQGPGSAEAANQEAAQSPASNDSTESEQGDNPLENGDKVFTSQESADMAAAQTQGVVSVMSSQAVTGLQTVQTVNQNMVVGASAAQPVPAATLARKPGEVVQNPVQVAVSNQNQVCNYIAPVQMLGGTPGLQVAASNPLSNVVSYNPSLMSAPGQNVILPQGGGGQVILQQHPGQNQVATYVMPMVQQANQSVAVAQPANQGIALIQQNNQGMTVMQPANQVAVTTVTQSINLTTPIMSTSNQTSGVVTSAIPNQRDVRRSSTDCVKLPNSGQKNQNPSTKKSSKPKSKSSKKSGDSNSRPIASTPQPTASVHVPAGASSVTVPSQPTCLTTQAVSQMQTKVAQATNQSLVVLQQPNQSTQLMVQNPFAQSAVQVMTPHGPVTVPLVNNSIPMQVANHGIQPGHTQIIQTVLPGQVSPAVASQAPNPGQVLQSGNQTPQYIVTQNRVLQVVNPPTALPQQPKQVLINSNGQLILANSPQTFSNHIQVSQPHTLLAAPSSQAPTSQAIPAVQASQAQSLIPAVSSQTSNGQIISTIHMSTAASTVASKVQQLNSQAVNTQQLHVSTTVCSSAAAAPSITATIGTAAQHTSSPKDILARAAESIFASSVVPDCSPPLNVSPLKVNSSGAQASVATRVLPAPAVSCSAPKSTLPLIYPSTAIAQVTAPAKPKRRRSRPQKKKTVAASTAQQIVMTPSVTATSVASTGGAVLTGQTVPATTAALTTQTSVTYSSQSLNQSSKTKPAADQGTAISDPDNVQATDNATKTQTSTESEKTDLGSSADGGGQSSSSGISVSGSSILANSLLAAGILPEDDLDDDAPLTIDTGDTESSLKALADMRDSIVHMPDETNATKSSDSITNNSLSSSASDTINEVPPTTQIATISSQSVQMSTDTLTSVGHLSNVAAVRSTEDTGSMSMASVRDESSVQKQGAVSDVTLYTHQGTSVAASASLQSSSPMQSNYLASNQSAVSSASNIQTSVYSQPQTRHSSPAATFAVPSVSNPSPSSNTTVPSNSPSFETSAVSSQVHTHQTSHQLPGVGIPSPSSNNTNVPPRNQPSLAHLNVYATHSRAGDTRTTHSMYTTESAVTPIYTASQSQQNAMVSKSAAQTPVLPFPQIFHRPGSDAANQLHRTSSLSSSSPLSTATITSGSLTPNAVVSAGQLSPVLVSRQPVCAPTQYVPSNPLNQSSQALMRQPSPKSTTIPSPGTVSQRHAVSQPSHLNVAPPLFSVTESTTVALSRSLPVMTNQPMAAAASQRSQPVSHQLPRVAATTATVSTRASQGAVTHSRQTSGTTAQHQTGTKPQATQPATSQGVSSQFSAASTAPSTQRNTSEPPTTHSQETAKGQRSRKKNSNTSYSVQSLSQSTVASRPPTTSLAESSSSQFSAASAAVTPTTSSSTSKEPTETSPPSHVPQSSPHWSHKPPVQSYSSSTNFNFAVPSSVPAASAPHSMASNSNQETSASPFYLSTSAGQHSLWKPPPQHMHGRSQVQLQTPFSTDDPSTMRMPDASQIDTLPGQIHGGQSNTGSVPFTSYINQPGMIRGKEQQQHIQQHHQHQQQHQQHQQQQHQQQRQVRPQQFENSPLPCVSEVHTSVSGGQSSRPVAAQRPSPQQQRDQHSNKQQKQPQPSQQQQSVQHQQQHPPAQRQHQQQQQQQHQQRQQQHHQQQQQRQHQQQRQQQQQQQTQQQTAQQQRQHLTHQRPQQQHIPQQQTTHTVATHQPPQQPQTMQSMQSQVSQADKQRESTNQRQQRNNSNREPMARNQDKVPHSQYQRTPQQGQFSPSSSQSSMSMSQFNPNLHFSQRSPLDGSGASLQQSGSNTSVSNQNQQPSGRQSKSQAQKRQHPSDSQQNKGSKRMTTASNRSQGSQQSVRQEYRSHSSDMSRNSSNAPRTSPTSQPQSIGRQLRGNHIDSESRTTQPVGLDTAVWPAFPQRNANPNIGPDLNNAPFLGFGNAPQHSSYNISSSQPTTSSTSMDNTGNFLPSFSPPRHLSGPDMPTYFPPPLPNHILTSPPQPPKPNIGRDAEISAPFNPMFTPSRPSGIGMNFQTNFPVFQEHQPGFNIGKTSSGIAPPITSNVTVTPHVSNFNVSNIFPEITGAGTSSQTENIGMNISSLRLPVHGNPTINLDPGVTSLHNMGNKPPPPPPPPAGQPFSNSAMSINNLLGPSHGAEDRPSMRLGLNSTLSTPFHSSTFNSGIPPLNLP